GERMRFVRAVERVIDDAEVKRTRTTVTAPQVQDQSVRHRQRGKAAFPPPPWFSSLEISAPNYRSTTRWAIAHPLDIQATSPRVPVPQGRPSLRGGTNWGNKIRNLSRS